MPSVHRGFDALWSWFCLRPRLHRYLSNFTLPYSASKSLSFLSQPDIVPTVTLCRTPAKKILQNCFIRSTPATSVPPSLPSIALRFSSFRRIETGSKDPPRLPKLHEFKDTPQGFVSPELVTPALYDELQHVSLKGDFIRTHVLVEALVKERGEEPNIQLYLALILANTSPQHGSPAEVGRLLDEMKNEGLGPDPAIYHAVLKVAHWRYHCDLCELTRATRSSPYIRIM